MSVDRNDYSLLWNTVSGDHEELSRTAALVQGKVNVAPIWPFLSSARDERDFENRLELSLARIEASVDPSVYEEVVKSLRDDYRAVKEASEKNPYTTGERKMCQACNGWGSHGNDPADSTRCTNCDGKGYTEHKKEAVSSTSNDELNKVHQKAEARTDEETNDDHDQAGKHKHATNYQPDPSAAWRYYAPYADLSTRPLDNGSLQDSDGFVKDLAGDEGRSNEVIEQRQLTPGTWAPRPETAMPERPMPFSQERGYQPVASSRKVSEATNFCPVCGEDASASNSRGYTWKDGTRDKIHTKPCWDQFQADLESDGYGRKKSSLRFDKEGFLVVAGDTAKVSRMPDCDIHKYVEGKAGVPAKYDGKTVHGPWANMCEDHFQSHGVGLGTGRGQKLVQASLQSEAVYHESYGEVSRPQLAAYRKHNIPPALHDELAGYFGSENHGAITNYVKQHATHYEHGMNYGDVYRDKPSASGHLRELEEGGGGWGRIGGKHGDPLGSFKLAAPKGPANYSDGRSPCCGDSGHRPDKKGDFFCMSCGNTFKDKSIEDTSKQLKATPVGEGLLGYPKSSAKTTASYVNTPEPKPGTKIDCPSCGGYGKLPSTDGHERQMGIHDSCYHCGETGKVDAHGEWSNNEYARGHDHGSQSLPPEQHASAPYVEGHQKGHEENKFYHHPDNYRIPRDGQDEYHSPGAQAFDQEVYEAGDYGQPYHPYRQASLFDKEGFLIESFEGRGIDPLSVAAPGTPTNANPYYFDQGTDGIVGNDGFPVDPGPEPHTNQLTDTYGDVAPQSSSGSTEGTVDGQGYSRQGSRNFT